MNGILVHNGTSPILGSLLLVFVTFGSENMHMQIIYFWKK
jgi:hypothetical protein